jgi:hypothetical protein
MSTNDDNKPSFFARYIEDPKKERHEPERMQTGSADLVAKWERTEKAKAFLANILANGPMPAAAIIEHGAARGFSERQLAHARKSIGAVAFKEKGKGKFRGGRWFWTLTQLTPEQVTAVDLNDRYTRRLRDITRALGYRLQPTNKYLSTTTTREDDKQNQ